MNPLFKERRGKSDMPYIRTKDFIHDSKNVVVVNENGTLVVIRGIDKDFVERTHGRTWNTGTNVVLAQKNTIEELCDAFVMFCPNTHCRHIRVYKTMHSISFYLKRDKRWNGNMVDKVYGAIWTDKGLIFVAKMNDKGEFELL